MGQTHSHQEEQQLLSFFEEDEVEYLQQFYKDVFVNSEMDLMHFLERFEWVPKEVIHQLPALFCNVEYVKNGGKPVEAKAHLHVPYKRFLQMVYLLTKTGSDECARAIHMLWDLQYFQGSLEAWARVFVKLELSRYVLCSPNSWYPSSPMQLSEAFYERVLLGRFNDPLPPEAYGEAGQFMTLDSNSTFVDYKAVDLRDVESFTRWISYNRYIQRMIENFFLRLFQPIRQQKAPAERNANPLNVRRKDYRKFLLKPPKFLSEQSASITAEECWFLQFHLKPEFVEKWLLIFDDRKDGFAWHPFTEKITMCGSTLVLVKDKKGALFGCFAEKEWDVRPDWFGTPDNFLFTLRPKLSYYPAASYNSNFQYFEFGTQTLPNGLGMGGQFDYFGFFISSDFIHGHSRANPLSSTFQNPTLAATPDFEIDHCQVIRVKAISKEVLERERGLRAQGRRAQKQEVLEFLDMAGVTMYTKQAGIKNGEEEDE